MQQIVEPGAANITENVMVTRDGFQLRCAAESVLHYGIATAVSRVVQRARGAPPHVVTNGHGQCIGTGQRIHDKRHRLHP